MLQIYRLVNYETLAQHTAQRIRLLLERHLQET